MADSDSFVQEVTEEVRRDAMYAAWRKYGPLLVGAIVLVIVGTAAQAWWKNSQVSSMRDAGEAFLQAQAVEEPADAAEAFLTLSNESEGDYAAMAGLRAAASFGAAGDVDRAVEEYEAVAGLSDVDQRLIDLAKLRAVMIRADTMDPAAMLDELQPLSAPGEPWRLIALEFTAAAHVRAGDDDKAIDALSTILEAEGASPSLSARAREMILALGGTPPLPVELVQAEPEAPGDDTDDTNENGDQ